MALFDTTAPTQAYYTPLKLATGQTRLDLALAGYKPDGSQNTFGAISSWIPGVNIALNQTAKRTATNAGLSGVAGNIADDTDNRISKLMIQLGVAQGVAGAVTGNPRMILSGLGNTTRSVAGLAAAGSGPDRTDDGSVTYM